MTVSTKNNEVVRRFRLEPVLGLEVNGGLTVPAWTRIELVLRRQDATSHLGNNISLIVCDDDDDDLKGCWPAIDLQQIASRQYSGANHVFDKYDVTDAVFHQSSLTAAAAAVARQHPAHHPILKIFDKELTTPFGDAASSRVGLRRKTAAAKGLLVVYQHTKLGQDEDDEHRRHPRQLHRAMERDKTARFRRSDASSYEARRPAVRDSSPSRTNRTTTSDEERSRVVTDEILRADRLTEEQRVAMAALPRRRRDPAAVCTFHRWYLDFARMGWTSWIRFPTGYYANYCSGSCGGSGQTAINDSDNLNISNHAFVKSLYKAAVAEPTGNIPAACCVPVRLASINILYHNDEGQWVLREMKEMIAEHCGCL